MEYVAVGCRGEQPRVSGEKIRQVCCQRGSQGTTPHTRGKHRDRVLLHLDPRNNPARAGKRVDQRFGLLLPGEQPRTRGEKLHVPIVGAGVGGTTPRTRGKVGDQVSGDGPGGDNPAYAGKRLHDQQVHQSTIQFSFNCAFYSSAVCAAVTILKFVTSPAQLTPPWPHPPPGT